MTPLETSLAIRFSTTDLRLLNAIGSSQLDTLGIDLGASSLLDHSTLLGTLQGYSNQTLSVRPLSQLLLEDLGNSSLRIPKFSFDRYLSEYITNQISRLSIVPLNNDSRSKVFELPRNTALPLSILGLGTPQQRDARSNIALTDIGQQAASSGNASATEGQPLLVLSPAIDVGSRTYEAEKSLKNPATKYWDIHDESDDMSELQKRSATKLGQRLRRLYNRLRSTLLNGFPS